MIDIPNFDNKEQLFKYLRENKQIFLTAKKNMLKHADAVVYQSLSKSDVNKSVVEDVSKLDSFNVSVAINTTNIMDSHDDVHIDGLWNKTLKEQKILYLLQEHQMSFDHIISDNVSAKAVMMNWSDLGYDYKGQTQVLQFDATIDKDRNKFMAEQYAKDRVKNHSVGMRYVKLEMAINSNSAYDKEEKAIWDKYYPIIVNKELADEKGYFWAVTEAKLIEGSAVPLGSNHATPTISIGKKEPIIEPINITPKITQESAERISKQIIKNLKN